MSEVAVAEAPIVESPVETLEAEAPVVETPEVSTPEVKETPAPVTLVEPRSDEAIFAAYEANETLTAREADRFAEMRQVAVDTHAAQQAAEQAAANTVELFVQAQIELRGDPDATEAEQRHLERDIREELQPIVANYDAWRMKPLTQSIGVEVARLAGNDPAVLAQLEKTHPAQWPSLLAAHITKTAGGIKAEDVTFEWVKKNRPSVLDEMHSEFPERGIVKPTVGGDSQNPDHSLQGLEAKLGKGDNLTESEWQAYLVARSRAGL